MIEAVSPLLERRPSIDMKTLLTLLLNLSLPVLASAALTLQVDPVEKEYFLSGSASGFPEEDFFFGNGQIAWDNGQTLDGGYVSMLSEAAFSLSGNTSSGSFILFLHGNGNVNGAFDLDSANFTTLTGNSSVRFDYSGWAPALIAELESKAAAHEVVSVANGASPDFALAFDVANVPEPSAATLVASGLGFAFLRRVRRSV